MPKDDIPDLRSLVDDIDLKLVELLNQRAEISIKIGDAKRQSDPADVEPEIFQPDREGQVLTNVQAANRGPLTDEDLQAVWADILSSSRSLQQTLEIGYLGPPATFTEEAAKRCFGSSVTYTPCNTIADVFYETRKRTLTYGVVPIENSTEGAVTHTMDMLVESDLQICAEIRLPVAHYLLSNGSLEEVEEVYSHQQALAQCRRWLSAHLPSAKRIEASSTALAAQMAQAPHSAAISTLTAAKLYNLEVVAEHIEDSASNVTRFLVIGIHRANRSGSDRTALVFSVRDRVGALRDALTIFASSKINLTRIESRPSRRKLWDYLFFVDLEGHPEDGHVELAIDQLEQECPFVKVLGTWPHVSLEGSSTE
jgi:chorismate mutase/prephenate dehydratase